MVRVALIFLLFLFSASSFGAGFGGVSVRAPSGVKVSGTDGIFNDLVARDTSIHLRGSHKVNLDFQDLMRRDVSILSGRAISPSAMARAAVPYVRTLGPAGLAAGVLAGYLWNQADLNGDGVTGENEGNWMKPPVVSTTLDKTCKGAGSLYAPGNGYRGQTLIIQNCGNYETNSCEQVINNCPGFGEQCNGYFPILVLRNQNCLSPDPFSASPVTDEQMENDLSKEFANDLSKAVQQATHLLNSAAQGFMNALFDAADPISETSGPTSLPSSTTTTSTTGPDGTTTTTTTTTPKLNYDGGVVTVTVEQQTTTQEPDGSTTTTTTTMTSDDSSNGSDDPPPPVTVDLSEIDICAKNPDIPACKDFCISNPDVPACKDFCDSHPEAPNCRLLGDLSEPEMPEQDIPLEWASEKSASGTCPAPISLSYLGQSFYFSWDYVCRFAGGIRPLVILMSVLGSGIWIFGVFRG